MVIQKVAKFSVGLSPVLENYSRAYTDVLDGANCPENRFSEKLSDTCVQVLSGKLDSRLLLAQCSEGSIFYIHQFIMAFIPTKHVSQNPYYGGLRSGPFCAQTIIRQGENVQMRLIPRYE